MVPLPQQDAKVFGRYALYDEIAAGGMATVHIGRLLGPVGFSRTVAIKRLHAQFAKDPDFVSMFLDEGRLAARIRHPNVIGTLDVVALEGELFLVMEYVPGESLARLWRTVHDAGKAIPLPIISAIVTGVLDGLHAAHEATNDEGEPLGIVHRDVSPHNVLVGTDGIARVLDFGVAKAAGRLQSTHNGQLKGKISYMAPEQVQGTVDRRSDVYSASVVLWEALTGKRLFFAETQAKTLANVLYPRVDPPSRLVPSLSREIDEVVMCGLDPNPDGRFSTAREMGQALQQAIAPASAYDVGDWVESTAGRSIALRATRVAMIARSSPVDSGPRTLQLDETSLPISHFALRTQGANDQGPLSASSPSVGQVALPPPSKARVAAIVAIMVSLCATVGFVAFHFVNEAPVPFGAVPVVETMAIPEHGAPASAPALPDRRVSPAPASASTAQISAPSPPLAQTTTPSAKLAPAPAVTETPDTREKDRPQSRGAGGNASSTRAPAPEHGASSSHATPAATAKKPPPPMDFDHVFDSRH